VLAQYSNAGVWTPPHLHLIVLMGLPLLLAALWIVRVLRGRGAGSVEDPDSFAAIWAIVGVGLIYLPVVYQIKLLTAWQFPIAILAAQAWHAIVLPWLAARRPGGWRFVLRPGLALALLLVCIVPTNLYLYAWRFTELRRHDRPYYLRQDEAAALRWLAAHARPEDVVLARLDIGQFVPNYGASRAFLAHWAMTNHFFQRRDEVDLFFSANVTDDIRRRLLDRDGVTLVLRDGSPPPYGAANGNANRTATAFEPATSPLFEPVFTAPHAAIFRYRPGGQQAAPRMRQMEARAPR
jgi:hypothetical protein